MARITREIATLMPANAERARRAAQPLVTPAQQRPAPMLGARQENFDKLRSDAMQRERGARPSDLGQMAGSGAGRDGWRGAMSPWRCVKLSDWRGRGLPLPRGGRGVLWMSRSNAMQREPGDVRALDVAGGRGRPGQRGVPGSDLTNCTTTLGSRALGHAL